MSFDLICKSCGAASGPSVGICPFCKTLLTSGTPESQAIKKLRQIYNEGRVVQSLVIVNALIQQIDNEPEKVEGISAHILCAQILIDTEGPNSRVRNLLGKAYLIEPNNQEIADLLEIVDAKFALTCNNADQGKLILEKLIRRNPTNSYANFVLGAHLFWVDGNFLQAIPYIEKCVSLRPNFLRGWACLGGIAKKMGNSSLATHAFQECLRLETDNRMRETFQKLLGECQFDLAA